VKGGRSMAANKKILVSMPEGLLHELDRISKQQNKNRSQVLRNAMQQYILQQHKIEMRERLVAGYQEMADINLEWAELALPAENALQAAIETMVTESDEG